MSKTRLERDIKEFSAVRCPQKTGRSVQLTAMRHLPSGLYRFLAVVLWGICVPWTCKSWSTLYHRKTGLQRLCLWFGDGSWIPDSLRRHVMPCQVAAPFQQMLSFLRPSATVP